MLKNKRKLLKVLVAGAFVVFLAIGFFGRANSSRARHAETRAQASVPNGGAASVQMDAAPEGQSPSAHSDRIAAENPKSKIQNPKLADEVQVESCLKCHNNIEPMHRYTTRGDVFDKLDAGRTRRG